MMLKSNTIFPVRRTARSGPAPGAAAWMVFALSLHLILSAVAGIVAADPSGPIRPLAAADTVLCTGSGMRTLPTATGSPGVPLASADSLCALCVPVLPDDLPAVQAPSPAVSAFTRQAVSPARSAPALPALHRPQPRAPPILT